MDSLYLIDQNYIGGKTAPSLWVRIGPGELANRLTIISGRGSDVSVHPCLTAPFPGLSSAWITRAQALDRPEREMLGSPISYFNSPVYRQPQSEQHVPKLMTRLEDKI